MGYILLDTDKIKTNICDVKMVVKYYISISYV